MTSLYASTHHKKTTAAGLQGSRDQRLTISLGFASTCGHPDERVEQLLGRADAALYRAKAEGRNRASAAD